jgi:hypothetical protein
MKFNKILLIAFTGLTSILNSTNTFAQKASSETYKQEGCFYITKDSIVHPCSEFKLKGDATSTRVIIDGESMKSKEILAYKPKGGRYIVNLGGSFAALLVDGNIKVYEVRIDRVGSVGTTMYHFQHKDGEIYYMEKRNLKKAFKDNAKAMTVIEDMPGFVQNDKKMFQFVADFNAGKFE